MPGARLIDIGEVGEAEAERWRRLAERAVEPNPFFEADFVLAGARHLSDPARALAVVEEGDEWRACLPLAPGRWRRALPATFAWRGLYGFLGTPLVARGAEGALDVLLDNACEHAGRRALAIERASADGALDAALSAPARGSHRLAESSVSERATLERREDGEYLGHVKPHHLREFKRQRRRLAEQLGAEIESHDRAGDPGAVDDFLVLERGGWKGRADTALASAEADARFFGEVCERFQAAGRLQLLELRAGNRILAMKCNLLAAPGSFAFKIAFDEEFARYSPGIQLELENIDFFHRAGLEWMDSCADPDNAMINRLWAGRRSLQTLLYVRRGLAGAAMMAGLRAGLRMRGRPE